MPSAAAARACVQFTLKSCFVFVLLFIYVQCFFKFDSRQFLKIDLMKSSLYSLGCTFPVSTVQRVPSPQLCAWAVAQYTVQVVLDQTNTGIESKTSIMWKYAIRCSPLGHMSGLFEINWMKRKLQTLFNNWWTAETCCCLDQWLAQCHVSLHAYSSVKP